MATATVSRTYSKLGHWSFDTNDTLGGVDTEMNVLAGDLAPILNTGGWDDDLLIHGLSIQFVRGGGGMVLHPRIVTNNDGSDQIHYLTSWTMPAITQAQVSYYPLQLTTHLSDAGLLFVHIVGTFAALDVIRISAWGTYLKEPSQEPTPVDVKSVQFIKSKPKAGVI